MKTQKETDPFRNWGEYWRASSKLMPLSVTSSLDWRTMTRLGTRENFPRKPRGYWGHPHPVTCISDTDSQMIMMMKMMMVYWVRWPEQHSQVHQQDPKPTLLLFVPMSVLTALSINSRKMNQSMKQALVTQTRQKKFLVFFQLIPTLLSSPLLCRGMLSSLI